MERKILYGLNAREYEHPYDKKALEYLEKTPGLEPLVRKFNKHWNDKLWKIQVTGSYIKINKNNFPEVHRALQEACSILNMKKIPKLYIKWDYSINAFTAGVEDPIIVINSGCVDLLSHEELLYILGHELGHIKSEHVLYHQMADVLPILGNIIGSATLGIGNLISTAVEVALLNWQRMSEFTADRCGLLVCQNVDAATTATIKLAGLPLKYMNEANVNEFINQAKEFEGFDYDNLDKTAKIFSTMFNSHPWTVMRASELYKWIGNEEYDSIINKKHLNNDEKIIITCSQCNSKMRVPKNKGNILINCPKCGNKFEAWT